MAKKDKKYDASEAPVQEQVTLTPGDVAVVEAVAEAAPPKPALPAFHLDAVDGTQFKLIRYPLPKRHEKNPEGDFKVKIDGVDVPCWKTDSKGWAKEGTELTYVYMRLPVQDITVYVVLRGEDIAGQEFICAEGEGTRPNPKAESKMTDAERAERARQAKITREANKQAKLNPQPAAETQPEGEAQAS
jgi:hypothetical protein